MITTIIRNDGEDTVTRLTYQNLWHELKDIAGAELVIAKDWWDYLPKVKNKYVCLVEADCLVSEGYFIKQLKEFRTSPGRKISMLTAGTGVRWWNNKFYGYHLTPEFGLVPNKAKKSTAAYPVQVGYVPGAIIRKSSLLAVKGIGGWDNLVYLSGGLSLAFWRQSTGGLPGQNGNQVFINPSVTYVTTDESTNDSNDFDLDFSDLQDKFVKESI